MEGEMLSPQARSNVCIMSLIATWLVQVLTACCLTALGQSETAAALLELFDWLVSLYFFKYLFIYALCRSQQQREVLFVVG